MTQGKSYKKDLIQYRLESARNVARRAIAQGKWGDV